MKVDPHYQNNLQGHHFLIKDDLEMRSKYLSSLNDTQKDELRKNLWEIQKYKCFICQKEINIEVHKDNIDIDHIIPLI